MGRGLKGRLHGGLTGRTAGGDRGTSTGLTCRYTGQARRRKEDVARVRVSGGMGFLLVGRKCYRAIKDIRECYRSVTKC